MWQPRLLLYAHPDFPPMQAMLTLSICTIHMASTDVEDYLTDDAWKKISTAITDTGKAPPVRTLTSLSWAALQ